jgi:hypothetical protein
MNDSDDDFFLNTPIRAEKGVPIDIGIKRAEKARNKNKTTKNIIRAIKNIKKDIRKRIKDISNIPIKKSKSSNTLDKAVNLAFDMASQPKGKKDN